MRLLLVTILVSFTVGCGGGVTPMTPDLPSVSEQTRELPPLEVAQPQGVSVDCTGEFYCSIYWEGGAGGLFDSRAVIVYRNTADDFHTATEIGRENFAFLDVYRDFHVEAGTRYYYWVVFEENGVFGSPSASVSECVRAIGSASSCAPAATANPQTPAAGSDPKTQRLPFLREASDTHYQALKQPILVTEARQAPVHHDGAHLFVGVDQGAETMADLQSAGESQSSSIETVVTPAGSYTTSVTRTTKTTLSQRGDLDVRHSRVSQTQGRGGAAESLAGYLRESARLQRVAGGTPVVMRFDAPPVVYFGGSAVTAQDVNRLVRAVQLVNAALPPEWRMQIPAGIPTPAPTPETREGTIYVEFLPQAAYDRDPERAGSLGQAGGERHADGSVSFGAVTINKRYREHGERGAIGVLAHELIHALGIGHVTSLRSIMTHTLDVTAQDTPLSLLYPIDREALRALYGRMQAGDATTAFGPWADTSTYLLGNGEHAAFGVAWRNGYAEPWAHGYLPETDLADNGALTGRAIWRGALLGFTPQSEPVAGDANVGVNLDDLTGNATFTSLESWLAGEAPGAAGTGARWGRGSLLYSIAVTGNTFRQTGGDDGFLTGAFFGSEHQGMGGVLERQDLTAAFGGSR